MKALVRAFSVIVQLHRLIDLRHYSRLQTLAPVSGLAAVDAVRDILTLGPRDWTVCGDQHWPGVSWATCHVSRVAVFRMLGCTGPRSSACVFPPSECLHAALQCSVAVCSTAGRASMMLISGDSDARYSWTGASLSFTAHTIHNRFHFGY